jgi:hypothetical protein
MIRDTSCKPKEIDHNMYSFAFIFLFENFFFFFFPQLTLHVSIVRFILGVSNGWVWMDIKWVRPLNPFNKIDITQTQPTHLNLFNKISIYQNTLKTYKMMKKQLKLRKITEIPL